MSEVRCYICLEDFESRSLIKCKNCQMVRCHACNLLVANTINSNCPYGHDFNITPREKTLQILAWGIIAIICLAILISMYLEKINTINRHINTFKAQIDKMDTVDYEVAKIFIDKFSSYDECINVIKSLNCTCKFDTHYQCHCYDFLFKEVRDYIEFIGYLYTSCEAKKT